MITEEAKQNQHKTVLEEKKQFLKEIVDAAARYERLMVNKDFLDVLADMENVAKLHAEEVQGFLKAYSLSTSFFKKMRLAEVMGQHQMRQEQIIEAVNYPKLMVEKAKEARELLSKIREQELKEN